MGRKKQGALCGAVVCRQSDMNVEMYGPALSSHPGIHNDGEVYSYNIDRKSGKESIGLFVYGRSPKDCFEAVKDVRQYLSHVDGFYFVELVDGDDGEVGCRYQGSWKNSDKKENIKIVDMKKNEQIVFSRESYKKVGSITFKFSTRELGCYIEISQLGDYTIESSKKQYEKSNLFGLTLCLRPPFDKNSALNNLSDGIQTYVITYAPDVPFSGLGKSLSQLDKLILLHDEDGLLSDDLFEKEKAKLLRRSIVK